MGGRCHERLRAYANGGWYRGPRTPESFHDRASQVGTRAATPP
jgi:galactonate dehydratase